MQTATLRRLATLSAIVIVSVLALPARASAQQSGEPAAIALSEPAPTMVAAPAIATGSAPLAGPHVVQAGVSRLVTESRAMPQQQMSERRDVAWMVVGGAALVVGSMIDGDAGTIIMITGGVIGLMGLFRFMQ